MAYIDPEKAAQYETEVTNQEARKALSTALEGLNKFKEATANLSTEQIAELIKDFVSDQGISSDDDESKIINVIGDLTIR